MWYVLKNKLQKRCLHSLLQLQKKCPQTQIPNTEPLKCGRSWHYPPQQVHQDWLPHYHPCPQISSHYTRFWRLYCWLEWWVHLPSYHCTSCPPSWAANGWPRYHTCNCCGRHCPGIHPVVGLFAKAVKSEWEFYSWRTMKIIIRWTITLTSWANARVSRSHPVRHNPEASISWPSGDIANDHIVWIADPVACWGTVLCVQEVVYLFTSVEYTVFLDEVSIFSSILQVNCVSSGFECHIFYYMNALGAMDCDCLEK